MRKYPTSTGYAREIKMRRAAAGLCGVCGKPLDDNRATCSACRMKKNTQHKENIMRKNMENERSKKRKGKMNIDEVNAMAKERGISYGIMNLILEGKING